MNQSEIIGHKVDEQREQQEETDKALELEHDRFAEDSNGSELFEREPYVC